MKVSKKSKINIAHVTLLNNLESNELLKVKYEDILSDYDSDKYKQFRKNMRDSKLDVVSIVPDDDSDFTSEQETKLFNTIKKSFNSTGFKFGDKRLIMLKTAPKEHNLMLVDLKLWESTLSKAPKKLDTFKKS